MECGERKTMKIHTQKGGEQQREGETTEKITVTVYNPEANQGRGGGGERERNGKGKREKGKREQ